MATLQAPLGDSPPTVPDTLQSTVAICNRQLRIPVGNLSGLGSVEKHGGWFFSCHAQQLGFTSTLIRFPAVRLQHGRCLTERRRPTFGKVVTHTVRRHRKLLVDGCLPSMSAHLNSWDNSKRARTFASAEPPILRGHCNGARLELSLSAASPVSTAQFDLQDAQASTEFPEGKFVRCHSSDHLASAPTAWPGA